MKLIIAIIVVLGLISVGEAATIYVNNAPGTGNDSRDCNTATNVNTPKLTIIRAINDCAAPGNTIQVRAGNYPEYISNSEGSPPTNWPVGSSWNAGGYFLLEGYPGDTLPVIRAIDIHRTNSAGNGQSPQYIWLNKLDINPGGVGDSNSALTFPALYFTAHHLKFTNNKFHNVNNQIISGGAVGTDPTVDFNFQNNEVYDGYVFGDTAGPWSSCSTCAPGVFCFCSDGAYCMYIAPKDSIISDNYFHDCRGYAMHFYHSSGQAVINGNRVYNNTITRVATFDGQRQHLLGVIIDYGNNNLFYNNLIYDTMLGYNHPWGTFEFWGAGSKAYNNTISNSNGWGCYAGTSASATCSGNILFQLGLGLSAKEPDATLDMSNNFTNNPSFTSDFHLQSGSAARGVCPNFTSVFNTDKDNVARPASSSWDCGAYQFTAGGPPPTPTNPFPSNLRIITNQ